MDILGSQVHPTVQVLFPNNDAIFKDNNSPCPQPEVFILGLRSMKMHFNIFSASTFAQLKYHWTTVVSYRKQGDKQIPSIIFRATRRQVVHYSTRDYSQPTWIYSKKGTSCVTGKCWPNSTLIKKYVSFTAVSIIFVHPLYMLPSYIPWGD